MIATLSRLVRVILALCLIAAALSWSGTTLYAALHADPDPLPRAGAIVVLSGALEVQPGGRSDTDARVDRAIEIWRAGVAPILVMSGGAPGEGEASAAEGMRARAIAAGVPADAVLVEGRARSTLQNALFSRQLLGQAGEGPVVVVTHRYHLPRAWASFRWAGFDRLELVAADGPEAALAVPLREAVAWPANVLRAVGASLALALGAPDSVIEPLLR